MNTWARFNPSHSLHSGRVIGSEFVARCHARSQTRDCEEVTNEQPPVWVETCERCVTLLVNERFVERGPMELVQ